MTAQGGTRGTSSTCSTFPLFHFATWIVLLVAMSSAACRGTSAPATGSSGNPSDVTSFLKQAHDTMLRLAVESSQAGWVQETYITQDTEALASRANQVYMSQITDYAKQAVKLEPSVSCVM